MGELMVGTLMVLTVAGSGIAALPWTSAELRASVRAHEAVGSAIRAVALSAARRVTRRQSRALLPEPARAAA